MSGDCICSVQQDSERDGSVPCWSCHPPSRMAGSCLSAEYAQRSRRAAGQTVTALLSTEEGLTWRRLHHSSAQLHGVKNSSHLLAVFALEAMAELQVNLPTSCPHWLFSLFAVNTVLLISLHIFALVIATCLLPRMEAVAEEYRPPRHRDTHMTGVPAFSPHDRLHGFVALSTNFSHVLGLFLFLVEVTLLVWVKFWDYTLLACWAGTAVMLPVLLVFVVFCCHFHRSLTTHLYKSRREQLSLVESQYSSNGNWDFSRDCSLA